MDLKLIFDIEFARSLVKYGYCGSSENFSKRSLIYPFTTENLTGYFDKIDFKNKSVLTVAGSGDHALNAILYGAKDVNIFDINRFTKYYVDLKKAAIPIFNYQNFSEFFIKHENKTDFTVKKYKQINDNLCEESKLFWDALYSYYPGYEIRHTLFRDVIDESTEEMLQFNTYLNEEKYYKLQKIINHVNINFIESDISSLSKKINGIKYDLILLSNISDYIQKSFGNSSLEKYKKLVLNLSSKLTTDGNIALAYIYQVLGETQSWQIGTFNDATKRNMVFEQYNFKTLFFKSVWQDNQSDAVMVYTKK